MLIETLILVIVILILIVFRLLRELNKERRRPTTTIKITKKESKSDLDSKLVGLRENITNLRDQFNHRETIMKKLDEEV
ncbi:MAG: hypothetical protein JSW41_02250 [Candidatus Aenigmatarchaeota archaeon]|nr:MAG: hypothetical protein JSW41_02250 [Candidatus Aenigmarchaeota archaeon]